jgi:L,D-peptidoglycan transpeptidase YkuD (ErfK/YbiS/YcfS/YnhG family)
MGRTGRPALSAALAALALLVAACSGSSDPAAAPSSPPPSTAPSSSPSPTTPAAPASTAPVITSGPASSSSRQSTAPAAPRTSSRTTSPPAVKKSATRLPLHYPTHDATQLITVVADSTSSTRAALQAWRKSAGAWHKVGVSVTAHLGSDGLSAQPSESRSATPIGSFTLTQAFGYDSDPGTSLPYFKTTDADWWISHPGKYYNTHQRCTSSSCPSHPTSADEHLAHELPYYDYAVVIDYNTRNAPGGVKAGAGSAFFLHVTDGKPTAGCVSIPKSSVVRLLKWLTPADHPRIVIGVDG